MMLVLERIQLTPVGLRGFGVGNLVTRDSVVLLIHSLSVSRPKDRKNGPELDKSWTFMSDFITAQKYTEI